MNEMFWEKFSVLGSSVRPWFEEEFLNYDENEECYVFPSYCIDKLQAWVLVIVLLLCNFSCDFQPFANFFETTSSAFHKVITVTGATMVDRSDGATIVLKF